MKSTPLPGKLGLAAATVLVAAAMAGTEAAPAWAQDTVMTQSYAIGPVPVSTTTSTSSGTAVTGATLQVSQPQAGMGAQYIIGFQPKTPLNGGDTVTITAPPGTDLSDAAVQFTDATANSSAGVGPAAVRSATTSGAVPNQLVIAVPAAVPAGDQVYLQLTGVVNPVLGGYGGSAGNFTISTARDTAAVELPSYQVTASASPAMASVEISTPTPGASATYWVGDLQANAAMAAGATLELKGPTGTVFPSGASSYSITDAASSSPIVPTAVSGGGSSDVVLKLPAGIANGDYLTLMASGVTNPSTAGTYSMSVLGDVSAAVPPAPSLSLAPPSGAGYWLATQNGFVYPFGSAQYLGNMTVTPATGNVVGMATTPDGNGYWLVTADGTVGAFGDAASYGDLATANVKASDIVAIAATTDGKGYWLVGRDGGMFAFGDAKFYGSVPGLHKHVADIEGMVASPGGGGYFLVGSDGGVFSFGTAHFSGSLPGLGVHVHNIRAILPTMSGSGYVLVGSDGGAFVFGSGAKFTGSLPGRGITVNNIIGIALTPDNAGYYIAGADGTVYPFGDAGSFASPASLSADLPVVAIAAD